MNYIGSKYSLLDFLVGTITSVAGDVRGAIFADLFAGTGVVGKTFRESGCKVIANDIQYYSYVINKHFIENSPTMDAQKFAYLDTISDVEGFVYNNYCAGSGSGRNYFTDENGRKCDAIRIEAERLRAAEKITDGEYYWLIASLVNSIDRCANTASVYGAFLKHTKTAAAKPFHLELLPVVSGEKGETYNENISELIFKVSGDVLYLDPPYNSRQYCTNYHVLETVARYDNPTLNGKTGLRDYSSQKSEFCSRRTVARALDEVLRHARFKYIFLSYNNEGLLTTEEIRGIMESIGRYEVFTTDYKRFKADTDENRDHKSDSTMEYLHCLIK